MFKITPIIFYINLGNSCLEVGTVERSGCKITFIIEIYIYLLMTRHSSDKYMLGTYIHLGTSFFAKHNWYLSIHIFVPLKVVLL